MARKIAPSPGSLAPAWAPDHHLYTVLYHGCLRKDATAMLTRISHTVGHPDNDFGQGFYTTTLKRQAEDWAYLKHKGQRLYDRGLPDFAPVVVRFRVPRARLAALESLAFVRGDFTADEFWSLVQHCRGSTRGTTSRAAVVRHHERDVSGSPTWYDLVSGPVAAFWRQRSAMLDADQYSFHTPKGVDVLNDLITHGIAGIDYHVSGVVV